MADGPEATRDRVFNTLDQLRLGQKLGVAVSGGGDSMALLVILDQWGKSRHHEIRAVTVDHGLRPESRGEAETVAEFCLARGIVHDILDVTPIEEGGNLQARARSARYESIRRWGARENVRHVFLGHTMDDQAETVLLRLARGAGLHGLSAMAAERYDAFICWVRPLLETRRWELRELLQAEGIDWIDDPSNEDGRFDRIKMRKALQVLEPLGITIDGLAATAARLGEQKLALQHALENLHDIAVSYGEFGELRIEADAFLAAPYALRYGLMSAVLHAFGDGDYPPRSRSLAPLIGRLSHHNPNLRLGGTLNGCVVEYHSDRSEILVCRELTAAQQRIEHRWERSTWDKRWQVDAEGTPAGTHIGALGEDGLSALSRAERARVWETPENWRGAPRTVRLAVPGFWSADGRLLACPSASYAGPETKNWRKIRAFCNTGTGDLTATACDDGDR